MTQIQLLLIQEIIMRLILVLLKIQLTLKQSHLGNFLPLWKKISKIISKKKLLCFVLEAFDVKKQPL